MYSLYDLFDKEGPKVWQKIDLNCGYADPKGLFHIAPQDSRDAKVTPEYTQLHMDTDHPNWSMLKL